MSEKTEQKKQEKQLIEKSFSPVKDTGNTTSQGNIDQTKPPTTGSAFKPKKTEK